MYSDSFYYSSSFSFVLASVMQTAGVKIGEDFKKRIFEKGLAQCVRLDVRRKIFGGIQS